MDLTSEEKDNSMDNTQQHGISHTQKYIDLCSRSKTDFIGKRWGHCLICYQDRLRGFFQTTWQLTKKWHNCSYVKTLNKSFSFQCVHKTITFRKDRYIMEFFQFPKQGWLRFTRRTPFFQRQKRQKSHYSNDYFSPFSQDT